MRRWLNVLLTAVVLAGGLAAGAAERTVTAAELGALLGRLGPGDVVTVTGDYAGSWRMPSAVRGTSDKPIVLRFEAVTLDASGQSGSAWVLSGQGQPLHLQIEGALRMIGGRNNLYVSRSNITLAAGARLSLVDAVEDGVKVAFDVANNPVQWVCQGLQFGGRVEIRRAGQDGVDMGGAGYVFEDLVIAEPRDAADGRKNACAFRDKGAAGRAAGTLRLTIRGGVYPYTALSIGGRCDNSRADRWECEGLLADVRFEAVTAAQLIAFQAAQGCSVRAEAAACESTHGWRVVREDVEGGLQLASVECTVNGVVCVGESGELGPLPVVVEPAVDVEAQLAALTERVAYCEASLENLVRLAEAAHVACEATRAACGVEVDAIESKLAELGQYVGALQMVCDELAAELAAHTAVLQHHRLTEGGRQ